MGQKIRPDSYRLGIYKNWNSRWFAKKSFKHSLEEDVLIRKIIKEKIGNAGIDKIEVEKSDKNYRVYIKVAKPGLVIGRGGKGIDDLKTLLEKNLNKLFKERGVETKININLNIEELKRSEASAAVLAQNIAWDLEKRMPFRRTMKKALMAVMQNREVGGAKIKLSGRLDGNEISRREWLGKGKLPLQTLRSNIDYGTATAFCTYGAVGIKVWIYKGENV
ncbi:MAG: ribosomal protein S3 (BS3) [Parcubacteria group bacterium Athens0714_26]|nr:MAG: ribosomal protein S3 (BS3) [Parcubacteria group bacterium Athens1014_26]TSD03271.1 MAG: ribosomal protein S3 (BS3) [Parcubacteria group bacterium Athens0714_26]